KAAAERGGLAGRGRCGAEPPEVGRIADPVIAAETERPLLAAGDWTRRGAASRSARFIAGGAAGAAEFQHCRAARGRGVLAAGAGRRLRQYRRPAGPGSRLAPGTGT